MQMIRLNVAIALLIAIHQGLICSGTSVSKENSLMSFLRHFNETRNSRMNATAKQKARDFIISAFKQHGLDTWTEEFPSNDGAQYPGVNIVGVIPGLHFGNKTDKIFMIAAHYDSVATSPGVDDNGSGMAALLQTIKQYTDGGDRSPCRRDYSLIFVAFDLEERQPSCGNLSCSCNGILCGSSHFVKNFTAYLNETGSFFQGAVVIDTAMNYNATPNSQKLPSGTQLLIPNGYQKLVNNSFRGDFLTVIGRAVDDKELMQSFINHYETTAAYWPLQVPLGFQGSPLDLPKPQQNMYSDFLRSDHKNFWKLNKKAIFLTDTADFRGHMQTCYHKSCDSLSHVTTDMVGFLSKTADTLTSMAEDLASVKECGGLLNETQQGQLTSKYYPCRYGNNMDCVWTIQVPSQYSKYSMALAFDDFQLEESENCSADFIEIREGTESSSPLIGKYCGSKRPATAIRTEKGAFRVHFHTNQYRAAKGFKLSWEVEMPTSKADVPKVELLSLAVTTFLVSLINTIHGTS